jgi:ABC-type bacteriocin/lantibiotic exporter with double-glycine peptidase domain
LGEATSHLDLVNEQRVTQALAQLQLTRILIAHRPETIAHAQRVVQVRRGMVVECGVGAQKKNCAACSLCYRAMLNLRRCECVYYQIMLLSFALCC